MMATNKQIKILTLALLLIPNSSIFAQTPIANRMKVLVKTLPEGSEIVARYTDMKRHALYYILNNRLYKYDALNNSQDEINLENRNKIISSRLSKDGKTITIKAGKKQEKHLSDIEELDINYLKDYQVEYEKINIIVSSLRSDNLISKLIKTSRDIVKDMIKDKLIRINYELLNKSSYIIKENDIISIRKYGKYRFIGIIKETKKDNYLIEVNKYK